MVIIERAARTHGHQKAAGTNTVFLLDMVWGVNKFLFGQRGVRLGKVKKRILSRNLGSNAWGSNNKIINPPGFGD